MSIATDLIQKDIDRLDSEIEALYDQDTNYGGGGEPSQNIGDIERKREQIKSLRLELLEIKERERLVRETDLLHDLDSDHTSDGCNPFR